MSWNDVINCKLIEWGRNPALLEDDGIESPSPGAIQCAIALAGLLRDRGAVAPDSVLSDGNGGIVFEKRAGSSIYSYEIDAAGIEFIEFENGRQIHQAKVV